MRAFIVTCLLGLAVAAPQGYNYQSGQLQLPGIPASLDEQRIVQQALQAPKLQQIFGQPTQTQTIFQQQQQLIPQQQHQQVLPQQQHQLVLPQQQQQLLPQQNFAFNSLPQQQFQQQTYNPGAGASLVSKDIYVHVPPVDDAEERYPQPQLPVPPPRKHYRIVFIKAPTPAVSKAALRVKQAPVEEKTIIYVLTKKPDPIDLQTAIEEAAPKQISKPEVFFIKYKTQEEAAHAQRTIQAQYDQLGGTTQISDEGVAPVTSVIGSLDAQHSNAATPTGPSNGGLTGAIPNKYLPAHLRA